MGADYLSGQLLCVWGDDGPALDWTAGHQRIDTLQIEDGIYDLADLLGLEFEFDFDPTVPAEHVEVVRKGLHELLTETQQTLLGNREINGYRVGPLFVYESGGMSHGDSPTDALETWWKWSDELMPEEATTILDAVGFIAPLGTDNCPYEIVRKANA